MISIKKKNALIKVKHILFVIMELYYVIHMMVNANVQQMINGLSENPTIKQGIWKLPQSVFIG